MSLFLKRLFIWLLSNIYNDKPGSFNVHTLHACRRKILLHTRTQENRAREIFRALVAGVFSRDLLCVSGFTKEITGGEDLLLKRIPSLSVAPEQNVSAGH